MIISCCAARAVANSSPDHVMPWGTRLDNSRNGRFTTKLEALYKGREGRISVLDMGCSGGGFVRDCFEHGMIVAGLEGSDFSRLHHRAEWTVMADVLFTCDVTEPFHLTISESSEPARRLGFDVITSWELMEHIEESKISNVIRNVLANLKPGGVWITSIATCEDVVHGVRLHQTVNDRSWWVEKMASEGLCHSNSLCKYFNEQFVRGAKFSAPRSFHLVLHRIGENPPEAPRVTPLGRIYDRWHGSAAQRTLRRLVVGEY
jgi:SAM-dependent methyltransferase